MANFKLKDILNIDNLSKFFIKHKEFFNTFDFSLKHYSHIRKTNDVGGVRKGSGTTNLPELSR